MESRSFLNPAWGVLSPRAVTTAVFFAFALGIGLWAGSVPVLMHRTGLGAEGLGLALTLHSAAYIGAMTLAGRMTRRFELRGFMAALLAAHGVAFFGIFTATSAWMLVLALVVMGLTAGSLDLAMNTEATTLEHERGQPMLTRMHAAASGSFALGAIGGSLISTSVGPLACALLSAAVVAPVWLAVTRLGRRRPLPDPPPATLREPELESAGAAAIQAASTLAVGPRRKPDPVLLFGIVLGLSTVAELTAQMWSAKFLAEQAASLAALAGAGAALYAGCQSLVRLVGDPLRHRFGDVRVITVSLLLAAVGFGVVAMADSFAVGVAGFALVGLGTACVVPCCFAQIAAALPGRGGQALGRASLISGVIRLPTPLLLGLVAARASDATAFVLIAASLVVGVAGMLLALRHAARQA
ncbi:MFS transporter [Leptothrix discophora]|uniref:MFS transporter n=1 Tax=Leptothrix discophora TaxID=89 RepID=A0ABT9G5G1_LEPDI|nr:MFS transporter [Leptothrix discophora]MDP4301719.1 MFS transporter [Leptothrix discophora]